MRPTVMARLVALSLSLALSAIPAAAQFNLIPPGQPAPVLPTPGFPGLPTPGLPTPGLPSPGLPTPGLPTPGLPTPGLPTNPGLPTPGFPGLPTNPGLPTPGLPTPGLPGFPPVTPPVTPPPANACNQPANAATLRAQLLTEVNARRRSAGLGALTLDTRLQAAALVVVCDNARNNRLSHTTADGTTLGSRLATAGYGFRTANENLAAGPTTAAGVVQSWMGSPPHRANILAPTTRHFGAGVARSASGQFYWSIVSAAPR